MRRIRMMVAAAAALLLCTGAMAEEAACSYYTENGEHCWEYVGGEEASCTKDGYCIYECSVCLCREMEHIEAYGHSLMCIEEKEATCQTAGYSKYECAECGYRENNYYLNGNHNWRDQYELTAPTCIQEGFMLTNCKECGELSVRKIAKTDHAYGAWVTTIQPTVCSMGVHARTCTVCSRQQEEEFYPDGTLYRNMPIGEAVRNLQIMLTDCGYLDDRIDGEFGPMTERAVEEFQRSRGLYEDGIAWPLVVELLSEEWQSVKGAADPVYADGPSAQYLRISIVSTGDVFLRKGPGLGYPSLKAVKKGVELGYMYEAAADDRGVVWYQIQYDGETGWVSSKYSRARLNDIDYSMTRMPFETALDPSEYYLLEGGMELTNYYLCSVDAVSAGLDLSGLRESEAGRYEASGWAVRIGGYEYVDYMELYGGSYSLYGAQLYMHIDEVIELFERAGLYCSQRDAYECMFERPCASDSIYVNENGFDSYITAVFDGNGYVRRMVWHPYW